MISLQIVIAIALILLPQERKSTELRDADNEGEAFGIVELDSQVNEYTRRFCGKLKPEWKHITDNRFYNLMEFNRSELLALESYRRRMSDPERIAYNTTAQEYLQKFTKVLDALTTVQAEVHCSNLLVEIEARDRDYSNRLPRTAKFVSDYVRREGIVEEVEDDNNFFHGCVKTGFNNQVDFDFMLTVCECYKIVFAALSDIERDDYKNMIKEQGAAAANRLPQIEVLKPRLEQCAIEAAHEHGIVAE